MTLSRALAAKLRRCWCPLDAQGSDEEEEEYPPPTPSARDAAAIKSSLERQGRRQAPPPDSKGSTPATATKVSLYTDDSSCTGLSSIPTSSNRTSHCYEHRCSSPFVLASLGATASEPQAPQPLSPEAAGAMTLGFLGSWNGERLDPNDLSPRPDAACRPSPSPSPPPPRNTQSYPPAAATAPPPPLRSEISPLPEPAAASSSSRRAARAWPGCKHQSMNHAPKPSKALRQGSAALPSCGSMTLMTPQLTGISVVARDYQMRLGSCSGSLALASPSIGSPAGMPPGYWPALAAIMGRRLVRKSGSASMHQDRRVPSATAPPGSPRRLERRASGRKGSTGMGV